mmetsp:Transcript_39225/g.77176  ORF Transcript_39225/g.77176 Transcript_39225/m.77176 type:complete len:86 (+) Transcript_39225:2156-2413(+)
MRQGIWVAKIRLSFKTKRKKVSFRAFVLAYWEEFCTGCSLSPPPQLVIRPRRNQRKRKETERADGRTQEKNFKQSGNSPPSSYSA